MQGKKSMLLEIFLFLFEIIYEVLTAKCLQNVHHHLVICIFRTEFFLFDIIYLNL